MNKNKEIEKIFHRYGGKIQSVIRQFIPVNEDINDVKQEVYIKTWKNFGKFKGESGIWSWIRVITVNTCKDHLKSNKKKRLDISSDEEDTKEIPDNTVNFEKKLAIKERQMFILDKINKLPKKQRDVIIFHDIEELTYEEISKKLNCPIGTIKSRLFNARQILKIELQELLTKGDY
jgi:RNA polymerase sigma-70 factor (ECF subfamily)